MIMEIWNKWVRRNKGTQEFVKPLPWQEPNTKRLSELGCKKLEDFILAKQIIAELKELNR